MPSNPARTLQEFVNAAKAKPPNFGFGGSSSRMMAEYVVRVAARTEAIPVPFQSGAPALNALLGRPRRHHVRADRRGGVAGAAGHAAGTGGERQPSRSARFPDAPMLREAGFPGLEINGWIGMLAPANTPDGSVPEAQHRDQRRGRKARGQRRLRAMGYEPNQMPLAETGPFLTDSIETWRKMILATGMAIN